MGESKGDRLQAQGPQFHIPPFFKKSEHRHVYAKVKAACFSRLPLSRRLQTTTVIRLFEGARRGGLWEKAKFVPSFYKYNTLRGRRGLLHSCSPTGASV